MTQGPALSVIVPFYNEEDSIGRMHAAIVAAVEPLGVPFEMVFVDDGSRDRTAEIATEIARRDPRVVFVKFRRNYGQTPAMAAGIQEARGRVLVTMDGDLQNDPADIALFLEKIDEGYDIVVGWRFNRQDKLITRKIPSRIANWLIGKITGVPIKDNGCSLKAYRGSLIKQIPLYSEMHRFIPAMASIAGPRIAEIKVRHHARQFGQSKYGLSRIYKVLLDLMVIKTVASFTVAAAPVVQPAGHAAARRSARSRSATRCGSWATTARADSAAGRRHRRAALDVRIHPGLRRDPRRTDLQASATCASATSRASPARPGAAARAPWSRRLRMSESRMPVDISAIVPVGGRYADPVELYAEYRAGLEALGRSYEIIFVLDGPREKFAAGLKRLAAGGASFTVVGLTRPFGEATALMAGFEQAPGQIIVTLPAYHQIEAAELPKLVGCP